MRLRLIPLVIFGAALIFTVRLGGLYVEVGGAVAETSGKPIDLTGGMSAARVAPADKAKAEAAKPDAMAKPKAPSAKPEPTGTTTAQAAPPKAAPPKPPAEVAPPPAPPMTETPAAEARPPMAPADASPSRPGDAAGAAKPAADSKAAADGRQPPPADAVTVEATPPRPTLPRKPVKDEALTDPDDMSRGDLRILQELAQRRRELDQREQDLAMRDGLLKAAEKRVDEKIAELAKMKAQLEALVKQREEQQNVQLKSLVKIYENMKPKDAAQIFDQLDMTILVELLAHMKENKSAPVMAAMDPKRVKDVTARLINRRALGPTTEAEAPKTAAR
ncbi:MAG: MotE family protein [Candidatus Eiseniibacteriota bacterium]